MDQWKQEKTIMESTTGKGQVTLAAAKKWDHHESQKSLVDPKVKKYVFVSNFKKPGGGDPNPMQYSRLGLGSRNK